MCGRDIGFLAARLLLERYPSTVFVVNEGEEPGGWYRTPRELPIREIAESGVADFAPDLVLVAFYDRILPGSVFGPPRLGCWNLHLGDPERYRGAYPNIRALRNGDTEYAVAIHRVDAGIDTGPILARRSFPVSPDMMGRELYDRMTSEGLLLLEEFLPVIVSGEALAAARPQDGSGAESMKRRELSHELSIGDDLRNQVRALTFPPFPPPFFMIGSRRFVVVEDPGDQAPQVREDGG